MNNYRGRGHSRRGRDSKMGGMFDHAKYSQPVVRNLSESVLKSVRERIKQLVSNPLAAPRTVHRKRNHEEWETDDQQPEPYQKQQTLLPPLLMQSWRHKNQFTPVPQDSARTVPYKKRHYEEREMADRQPYQKQKTLLPPLLMQSWRPKNQTPVAQCSGTTDYNNINDILASTPNPRESEVVNAEKQEDVFPKKPPMNRIVVKALACYPNITLRPNEHTTLSDAAFSLVRRALMTAKDKNLFRTMEKEDNNSSYGQYEFNFSNDANIEEATNNSNFAQQSSDLNNPFQTISNQTLFIEDEIYRNRSYLFGDSNRQEYLDESPVPEQEECSFMQPAAQSNITLGSNIALTNSAFSQRTMEKEDYNNNNIYEGFNSDASIEEAINNNNFAQSSEDLNDQFQSLSNQPPLFVEDEIYGNPYLFREDLNCRGYLNEFPVPDYLSN